MVTKAEYIIPLLRKKMCTVRQMFNFENETAAVYMYIGLISAGEQ